MPLSPETKKKLGGASFVLFIAQIVLGVLTVLVAFSVGGGGHPPGGALLLVFFAFGVLFVAPVGVLLGAFGNPGTHSKSMIGLLGNAVVAVLVLWLFRLI